MNWAEWVAAALRVAPEPADVPDELDGASLVQLMEARNRMAQVASAARSVRLAIDAQVATRLGPHGAVKYGGKLWQPMRVGSVLADEETFWQMLDQALRNIDEDTRPRLIRALWSAREVKLTGLKFLAAALEQKTRAVRSTLVGKKSPEGSLSSSSKLPGWARDMAEGEALITAAYFPDVPDPDEPPEESEE